MKRLSSKRLSILGIGMLAGLLGATSSTAGWLRVDTATQRILHASEPPFTSLPPPGQTDIQLPGTATTFIQTNITSGPLTEWTYSAATGTAIHTFAPPPAEDPNGLRLALPTIFSGTLLQKRQRYVNLLEQYSPLGVAITRLSSPMSPDGKALVTEILSRVCLKVGALTGEILTAQEYDALVALAAQKNLATLVPARPTCM